MRHQPGLRRRQPAADDDGPGHVIESLTNATLYLVRVRASNDDGATYGHWSVVGRGRPFEAPAPEGFRATRVTQTSVTLRWDALLDATEYILEQKQEKRSETDAWTPVEGYFDHLPSQSRGHQPIAVAAGLDCNTDVQLPAQRPARRPGVRGQRRDQPPCHHRAGRPGPCPEDDRITNLLVTLEPNQASLSWAGPTDGNAVGLPINAEDLGHRRRDGRTLQRHGDHGGPELVPPG